MAKRVNNQPNTSVVLPREDRERLEELAREFGYTQTRGAGAGKIGSISALMSAIAKGELTLQKKNLDVTKTN